MTFQLTAARCGWARANAIIQASRVSTHSRAMRLARQPSLIATPSSFNSQPRDAAGNRRPQAPRRDRVSTHSRAMRLVYQFQVLTGKRLFQLTAARCGWFRVWMLCCQSLRFNSQPRDAAGTMF